MSSLFDPQQFLDVEVEGEMSTRHVPTPLGRYEMQIDGLPKLKKVIPGPGDDYETFVTFECDVIISGDALDQTGRKISETTSKDKNFARLKGNLDFTSGGTLDLAPGKNVDLGRIRAATGLNQPPPFKFKLSMLMGVRFSGEVVHKPDKKDPSKVYAEVRNPLPLA